MALYKVCDFETATANLDGGDPFDTIVEGDGTVDVLRSATGGEANSACMAIVWTNPTDLEGYGTIDLTNKGAPQASLILDNWPTHYRIRFAAGFPDVSGFTTGNQVKLIRFMYDNNGTPTELCSISWEKRATNYRWVLSAEGVSDVTGSNFNPSSFDYATVNPWVIDIISNDKVCFMQLSMVWPWSLLGETTGASTRIAFSTARERLPLITRVDIGAVSGNIAAPSASSVFVIDNIRIENDLLAFPGKLFPNQPPRSPAEAMDVAMHKYEHGASLPLDNAQCGLTFKQYAEFGTVARSAFFTTSNSAWCSTQLPIVPGYLYEISMTAAEDPNNTTWDGKGEKVGRGYTQIQLHEHHSQEVPWESPPYWGMEQRVTRSFFCVPMMCQNAMLIYGAEFVQNEYYVRRIRFFR